MTTISYGSAPWRAHLLGPGPVSFLSEPLFTGALTLEMRTASGATR